MNINNLRRLTNGKSAMENYIECMEEIRKLVEQKRQEQAEKEYIDKCFQKLEKDIVKTIEKSFKK